MHARWSAAFILLLAAGGGMAWNARRLAASEHGARVDASRQVAAELALHTADIGFYEARAASDPGGAIDRTKLAALYLQRARETNDFEDYLRAEQAARASLALRTTRNADAYAALVSTLLAQHRFGEARDAARQLVAADPGVDTYLGMLGEACLEAGDYEGARAAFDSISPAGRASLAAGPRLARWAEVRGDTSTARRLFRAALVSAQRATTMSREQVGWFHLRAADLELRQGRLQGAERALEDGLARHPADHRLLSATARLRAVRQDWHGTIQFGDSAIAIALDPSTLGLVSDAYAALGDSARAREYFSAMEAAVGQQPGAFHRSWSLFLLDRGERVREVLAAAQAEIATRPDIHGYDLLAWALHKSGRSADARAAMQHALAQGTQDAMFFYHAGMIELAAGDRRAARAYLERALAISRVFDHAAPGVARAALEALTDA